MTIGLDRDGLDEYIELNPSLDTVDELLETLVADGFISEESLERCTMEGSLLETGNLHMLLQNKMNTDNFCYMTIEEIADIINNPPGQESSSAARSARSVSITTAIPQV